MKTSTLRLIAIVAILVLIVGVVASKEFPVTNDGSPDGIPFEVAPVDNPTGEYVINFEDDTHFSEIQDYVNEINGQITRVIEPLKAVVVTLPDGVTMDEFPFDADIESIEADYYVSIMQAPNDPLYGDQWALEMIDGEAAWSEFPNNARTIEVAVIDTGVCMEHEDLVGRVLDNGYDFVDDDDDPSDVFGHGCSVAGIIAANTNNDIGIAGLAPNAVILPVRVLGNNGSGSMSDVAAGIVYSADQGVDIANLSLGSFVSSKVEKDAVDYADNAGVLIIASSGNSGGSKPGYPAAYDNVVAVGAVGPDGKPTSFSNRGGDIWGPGLNILTTYMNNTYRELSGTSFSAPYTSAVAAMLLAMDAELVLDESNLTWECQRQTVCEYIPSK